MIKMVYIRRSFACLWSLYLCTFSFSSIYFECVLCGYLFLSSSQPLHHLVICLFLCYPLLSVIIIVEVAL